MGIEIPDNQEKIYSFKVKPDVHTHPLYRCRPISFPWKCLGYQNSLKCFSGMNSEKITSLKSFCCIQCGIRYCDLCFEFYACIE